MQGDTSIRVSKRVRDALKRIQDERQLDSLNDAAELLVTMTRLEVMLEDHEQRIKRLEKKG